MGTPRAHSFLHEEGEAPSRAALLESALALFVRDGLSETSIRAIATAAGYTNPALYKFFESKDALALHLFERCYRHLVTELARSQRGEADYESNLQAVLATFLRALDEHPGAVLYVQETLRIFWRKLPASARRQSVPSLLRALLEQGQREGVVRADLDLRLALGVFVGSLAQVARMAYFAELPRPWSAHTEALKDVFHRAFGAPHRPAP